MNMKKCVLAVISVMLLGLASCATTSEKASEPVAVPVTVTPFTHDMYAGAPKKIRDAVARCDELVADAKYASALTALAVDVSPKDEDYLIYKRIEVKTRWFAMSMMHTMFSMQDFDSEEDLYEFRQNLSYGNQDMSFNLTFTDKTPEDAIAAYVAKYGETPRINLAYAQYYFDVSQRYGDQWLKPYDELQQLAFENFQKAIDGGFYELDTLAWYGEAAMNSGHDAESYAAYKELVQYVPDHGNYWFNLAVNCNNLNDHYDEGIEACRMAIKYPEDNIGYQMDYYRLMAHLYLKSGDLKSAEQALIDLTVAMPDQPYAFSCLGDYYLDYDENGQKAADAYYTCIETAFTSYGDYSQLWDVSGALYSYGYLEHVFALQDKAKVLFGSSDDALGFAWWVDTQLYYAEDDMEKAITAAGKAEELFTKAGNREGAQAARQFLSQNGR